VIDSAYIDDLQIHQAAGYFLTRITGLGAPAPRSERQERAQRHGLIDLTQFYGGRVLSLEGAVQAVDIPTAWDLFDQLMRRLALGSSHTFRFRRSGRIFDEQCVFTVDSAVNAPVDIGIPLIEWGVTIVSADPRIYSASLNVAEYDPTTVAAGGGTDIPMVFPLVFTTSAVAHLVVVNQGQFQTAPVLTIHGPVASPVVDNDTVNASLALNVTLGSSDVLVVDVANRRITLNGASRPDLFVAQTSTWWELLPGENQVRLRGSGMAAAVTDLSVAYRDARL
jgi:hypothetical protein